MAKTWDTRRILFNRMKKASSRLRGKKREAMKARWWAWADRNIWTHSHTGA